MSIKSALEVVAGTPEQIEHATRAAVGLENLPTHDQVENIVLLGVGGSGIAGDVVAAVASPFIPVPVNVVKNYEIPAYIGEGSLVFAMSYSGDTEETIEAASDAAIQGAKVVVISGGGHLAGLARSWGSPSVNLPASLTNARAALGALSVVPLAILEDIGLFTGANQWIDFAVAQLKARRDALSTDHNFTTELAERFVEKTVVVTGGGSVGYAAAQRWRTQINNNAKSIAFASSQPDASHNELNGWTAAHQDDVALVSLRHDDEHPQVTRRFELMQQFIGADPESLFTVQAEGDGTLAQLLDLAMIGDYVSLHMADIKGVDPTALPASDNIKQALAER